MRLAGSTNWWMQSSESAEVSMKVNTTRLPLEFTHVFSWFLGSRCKFALLEKSVLFFTAQNFYNKYFSAVGVAHQSEMNELSEIVTAEQLATSQLASKFR